MPSKLCDVNEAAVLIKSMVCELIDPLSVGKSDRGAHTHTNARTHTDTQRHEHGGSPHFTGKLFQLNNYKLLPVQDNSSVSEVMSWNWAARIH